MTLEIRPELKILVVLFHHFLLSNVVVTELDKVLRLAQMRKNEKKKFFKSNVSLEIFLIISKYLTQESPYQNVLAGDLQ